MLTTPITPTLIVLPSASFCSMSSRRRGERDLLAVAQHDEDDRVAGAARNQALHVGEGLDRLPSTLTNRSPGRKPAAAAGLSGTTSATIGSETTLP